MNCQELQKDIDSLKSQFAELQHNFEFSSDNDANYGTLRKSLTSSLATENEILEKYLNTFVDKNPELFKAYKFSGEIAGFNGGTIRTSTLLPDGSVFVGGEYGTAKILKFDESGTPYFSDKIKGIDFYFNSIDVAAPLPDGTVFVVGSEAKILEFDESGAPHFGDSIEGFNSYKHSHINVATPLPDGSVFVGGYNGEARILKFDESGTPYFGDEINGFDNWTISAATLLPDGSVFVGGQRGEARILKFDESGTPYFGDKIKRFDTRIHAVAPIPNDSVLVGGWDGETRILKFNKTGMPRFSGKIKGFNTKTVISTAAPLHDGSVFVGCGEKVKILELDRFGALYFSDIEEFDSSIWTATPLPDGSVFVGGANSKARILKSETVQTTDRLKEVLSDIAAKGEA